SPPSGYAPPPHGPLAPPPELPSYPTGHWWRFHDWHQPPTGCWAHHNLPRCGNLKAECTFIFGSCRAFYGEPCLKGRPLLPPVPVSSLRVPGFGPGEVGMGGCACSP
ncbi:MAG TPA: hypothetical protein VNK04_03775, partial [Gemmataceae bacterium]|nr:hypothetical protein [Gemmataceae bacterium]